MWLLMSVAYAQLSSTIAGQAPNSSIEWVNSNVTAFRCDIAEFSGPVQVLHAAPIEANNIELVFYSFASSEAFGFYLLDNYSETNSIIRERGQPDRVNAAAMFFDGGDDYPLAAFLFNERLPFSDEIFLCRFDAVSIECFDEKLQSRGASFIPFSGTILGNVYFYGNGIGTIDATDSGFASRPLFLVREITADEPIFDQNEFFVLRPTVDFQCADVIGFFQNACVGNCVQTTTLGSQSSVVDDAVAFLTCITQDAVGLLLIGLDNSLTPFSYLWIEGVDLTTFASPFQFPNELTQFEPRVVQNTVEPIEVFLSATNSVGFLGPFGACYGLSPGINETSGLQDSERVFCSSNAGGGLFEIDLPLEVGYCENRWNVINVNGDGLGNPEPCERFEGGANCDDILGDCDNFGDFNGVPSKPRITFIAESAVTNRNDGLNCQDTIQNIVEVFPTGAPTLTPAPSLTPAPTITFAPTVFGGGGADPVVVGPNGKKTQFWLPLGKWLSVLKTPSGTEFFIRCFGKPGTHAQWIDGILIQERNLTTVDVVIPRGDRLGKVATGPNDDKTMPDFVEVNVDGDVRADKLGARYVSKRGTAKVRVEAYEYPIIDKPGDAIFIATDAFTVKLFTMPARKYADADEAALYTHLDFQFLKVNRRDDCTGLLADFMFGLDTVDPNLKASYLKKPPILDVTELDVEPPAALKGVADAVYS